MSITGSRVAPRTMVVTVSFAEMSTVNELYRLRDPRRRIRALSTGIAAVSFNAGVPW